MYQQNYNINNRDNYTHRYSTTKNTSTKTKPSTIILTGVILLVIGIFITIVQVNDTKNYYALADEGKSTNAVVTDVDKRTSRSTRRSSSGRRRSTKRTYYYVTATYTVDNQNYNFSFRSYVSYNKGENISIFYEEDDPSNYVKLGDTGVASLVFDIAVVIVGGVVGAVGLKKYRDEKDLKAMGLL